MPLPTFLVIGPGKTGTTSLYAYLNQHPQVYMSPKKEPGYFSFGEGEPALTEPPRAQFVLSWEAYQKLFDGVTTEKAIGEATPCFFSERARIRIHRCLPEVTLISTFRQPVERAYSDYWMHRRLGYEIESDFASAYVGYTSLESVKGTTGFRRLGFLGTGAYLTVLQAWVAQFGKEAVHVFLYDDLRDNPVGLMQQIYRIIGVDESFVPDVSEQYNSGYKLRSVLAKRLLAQSRRTAKKLVPSPLHRRFQGLRKWIESQNRDKIPPLDPELRRELTELQRDDILRLQDYIGRDLSHWLA